MSLTYSGNDFSVAAVMESPLSLPQNMSAAREFVTPAQLPLILRNEEMPNEVDSAIADARESGRLIASHTLCNTKRLLQLLSADVPPTDAYVSEQASICYDWEDRKSTRLNSSHYCAPRMPSSACKQTMRTT